MTDLPLESSHGFVSDLSAVVIPAAPSPDSGTRVVWRCPEPDCDWRLNTASRQPSEADWRALGQAGPAHYADHHPAAPLPWELRVARDYRGVDLWRSRGRDAP